jgi:hypothetical protein
LEQQQQQENNPFMRIVQQSQSQPQIQQQSLFSSLQPAQTTQIVTSPFQQQPQQQQQPISNPFAQIASPSPFSQITSSSQSQAPQSIVYQPQTGLQFPSNGLFSQLGTQSSQGFMSVNSNPQFSTIQNTASASSSNLQSGASYAYSAVDDLNMEEMSEFKSDEFTMGRIPNQPPPRELC